MNVEEARRIAKEKIERLGQELQRGRSAALKAYLAAMARFPRYSVNNILLILAQKPAAEQCAGLKTWNRLGRSVRKGERGIMILAPITRRLADVDPSKRTESNAERRPQDGESDKGVVGFRRAYTFDVSQTVGAPLPDLTVVAGNPGPYIERLQQFATARGLTLEYSRRIAPARGACTGTSIILLPDLPGAEHLSTLAHELGHALLHQQEARERPSRTVRETEAEAVAYAVCEAVGLESLGSSDYIQLWDGNVQTLGESLERIHRTAATLIAAIAPDV